MKALRAFSSAWWPFCIGLMCLVCSYKTEPPLGAVAAMAGALGFAGATAIAFLRLVEPRGASGVESEARREGLMRIAISWLVGGGAAAGCGLFVSVTHPLHGMLIALLSATLTACAFVNMARVSLDRRFGDHR